MYPKAPRCRSLTDAVLPGNTSGNTNQRALAAMGKILQRAVCEELTRRQRMCVELYYGEHMTMQETADALSLTRSTVCKHLSKAVTRLRRALQYAAAASKFQ